MGGEEKRKDRSLTCGPLKRGTQGQAGWLVMCEGEEGLRGISRRHEGLNRWWLK